MYPSIRDHARDLAPELRCAAWSTSVPPAPALPLRRNAAGHMSRAHRRAPVAPLKRHVSHRRDRRGEPLRVNERLAGVSAAREGAPRHRSDASAARLTRRRPRGASGCRATPRDAARVPRADAAQMPRACRAMPRDATASARDDAVEIADTERCQKLPKSSTMPLVFFYSIEIAFRRAFFHERFFSFSTLPLFPADEILGSSVHLIRSVYIFARWGNYSARRGARFPREIKHRTVTML